METYTNYQTSTLNNLHILLLNQPNLHLRLETFPVFLFLLKLLSPRIEVSTYYLTALRPESSLGSIQAVRSTFLQPLQLLTQKAVFTHCKLHSLSIRQDGAFKGKQLF